MGNPEDKNLYVYEIPGAGSFTTHEDPDVDDGEHFSREDMERLSERYRISVVAINRMFLDGVRSITDVEEILKIASETNVSQGVPSTGEKPIDPPYLTPLVEGYHKVNKDTGELRLAVLSNKKGSL